MYCSPPLTESPLQPTPFLSRPQFILALNTFAPTKSGLIFPFNEIRANLKAAFERFMEGGFYVRWYQEKPVALSPSAAQGKLEKNPPTQTREGGFPLSEIRATEEA